LSEYLKSDQYSISTLHDIYGEENLQNADKFQIQSLATSYIENLGNGKFEIRPFHKIVQISTVNSILTKDVDHDGNRDIIMAGNLYPMDVRTVRNDASIGLWLRGDGRGNFNPVPYSQSGLNMPGDVRHLEFIEIGEEMFLLAAKNNDLVQFVKINDIEREDGK
jgi:hypothetical protein